MVLFYHLYLLKVSTYYNKINIIFVILILRHTNQSQRIDKILIRMGFRRPESGFLCYFEVRFLRERRVEIFC